MTDLQKELLDIARSAFNQLRELRREVAQEVRLSIECLNIIEGGTQL